MFHTFCEHRIGLVSVGLVALDYRVILPCEHWIVPVNIILFLLASDYKHQTIRCHVFSMTHFRILGITLVRTSILMTLDCLESY